MITLFFNERIQSISRVIEAHSEIALIEAHRTVVLIEAHRDSLIESQKDS